MPKNPRTETKEEVYDREIYPLMKQVIAICKKHKIACVASFHTPNEDEPFLSCTTALLAPEFNPPDEFMDAHRAVYGGRAQAFAITVTKESR